MKRYSILDHFILSSTVYNACFNWLESYMMLITLLIITVYNTCVNKAGVLHDVDNTSDHDPIFVEIKLDVNYMGFSSRDSCVCTSAVLDESMCE